MQMFPFARCALTLGWLLLGACDAENRLTGGPTGPDAVVLDYAPRRPLTCEVQRGWSFVMPPAGPQESYTGVVVDASGALWAGVARSSPQFGSSEGQLVADTQGFSAIERGSPDGTLEADSRVIVDADPFISARFMRAWPDGGLVLLLISNLDVPKFARTDQEGRMVVGATPVPALDIERPIVDFDVAVSKTETVGVLYEVLADPRGFEADMLSVHFVALDADGQPLGEVQEVLRTPRPWEGRKQLALIAMEDGGFASLIIDHELGSPVFTRWSASGQPMAGFKTVAEADGQSATDSRARDYWVSAPALLDLDDGYLAAWTEGFAGNAERSSYAHIRLSKLNRTGSVRGHVLSLQALEPDSREVEPVLASMGGNIALSWSGGPHELSYCEDEYPNSCEFRSRTKFVLLDPRDLAPRSEVLEILRDPEHLNGDSQLGWVSDARLNVSEQDVLLTGILADDRRGPNAVVGSMRGPGFASATCR